MNRSLIIKKVYILHFFAPNAYVCVSEQLRLSRSCSNQVFQANAFFHVTEVPRWGVWEQNQQFTVLYSALIFFMVIFVKTPIEKTDYKHCYTT